MTPSSPYNGRKVLVTGATGFIGSHLCQHLLRDGAKVHGTGRQIPPDAAAAVQWKRGDLADPVFVDKLFAEVQPEFVFHLAGHVVGARDIAQVGPTFRDILAATVNVLQSATSHGKPRLILTGSMEEPDPGEGAVIPSSPYAAAKSACTGYASMFHALYELPVVNARVFMVYGPGQRDVRKLVPYVTLALLRGEAPQLSGGERLVDWVYVDDVVEGLCALGCRPGLEGGRFDLGTGNPVPVRDVVLELVRIIEPAVQPQFGAIADRPMEQIRKANVAATTQATGWAPRTSLEDGLRATVRWYSEHAKRDSQP